jgi:hypothetical protein
VDGEWVVVIVAAVIALSVLLAAGWVIYSAPALLSEVLLDTGIAGGLWRSVFRRRGTGSGWLSALRHTWGLGLVVLLVFAIGGHVLDRAVPGAETLGQALHLVIHRGDAPAEEPR